LDLSDLTAFLAPIRRLGTSPGDTNFNIRFDLAAGPGGLGTFINLTDLTTLIILSPPMFVGQRAFNHTCP
jgi:hypothetical protein